MSVPILFIDRDGALVEQRRLNGVDDPAAIRFRAGVFAALGEFAQRGFRLIMVAREPGPALPCVTTLLPRCQEFLLESFRSQGICFDSVLCGTDWPIKDYLADETVDLERSAMISDHKIDSELASSLGIRGLQVSSDGPSDQSWPGIVRTLTQRRASLQRQTRETDIQLCVNLDAEGEEVISTGIGFFDHMLEQLARHGGFALELSARGDLQVDEHHTVEDCALALGAALRTALGPKLGLARYGFALPMDEAKATVLLDLSGRPFSQFSGAFARDHLGGFPTELVPHFFRSLSEGLAATLHISVVGENTHHMVEACFKGVGRALRQAVRREGRALPSTKGSL